MFTLNKKERAKRRERSLATLRDLLPVGSHVYTILVSCASNGMSRRIDLYTVRDNEPIFLTGYVSHVLDYGHSRSGGLVVGGCGMDMGYHLVNSLSYALHGHDSAEIPAPYRPGYTLHHAWL